MTTRELIDEIRAITVQNLEVVHTKIIHLSENQKSWKINNASWSINEIFAHINEYSKFYHSTFLDRIAKTRFREPSASFISSPLGRSAWLSMKLGNARNVKRKFKSLKMNNPSIDITLLTGNEIADFEKSQNEFLEIIDKAEIVNLRKVKVPISIAKIIRFRLGDALLFVTYHNERHIQQVLNVMHHPKFPKN